MTRLDKLIVSTCLLAALVCAVGVARKQGTPGEAPELRAKLIVAQARDDARRAAKYHALVGKIKIAQAELEAFTAEWSRDCRGQGQILLMGNDGSPGCAAAPPTPSSVPKQPKPEAVKPKGSKEETEK